MKFYKHHNLEGCHAPFGASKSSWLRYSDDKAIETYINLQAATRGTRIHAWAKEAIELGMKQPKSKKTICAYINDAIGYGMEPEVVLYYSDRFFGTADAISFKNNFLRIHDLKTGKTPVHMEQLLIYVALFCLEYKVKPGDLKGCECRIYQNDTILYHNPTADEIVPIMDKIIHLDKLLTQIDNGEV